MEEQKRPVPPRQRKASTVPKGRVNFTLRISVELLDQIRELANDAQIVSLNSYITAIIGAHIKTMTAQREAKK